VDPGAKPATVTAKTMTVVVQRAIRFTGSAPEKPKGTTSACI